MKEPLHDEFGRSIGDLRLSVTDRCNLRCQYCMPAEGLHWLPQNELLSYDELVRVVGLLTQLGISEVRITGGEPLVRPGLAQLAARLSALDGLRELSLTTNGYLLERDAQALVDSGVARFNVSIDSLQRDQFFAMTRRDALERVLRGLQTLAAIHDPRAIKINAVAIRDFTERELADFAQLARAHDYEVRFIEFMPLDADHAWQKSDVLTGAQTHAAINALYPLVEIERQASATARTYRFADGAPGRIGLINPVSEPFCGDCNRIRLTAEGMLRTCLFSQVETDLRTPLRSGADDDELEALIRSAVARKEKGHDIGAAGFVQPLRTMSAIGG